MSLILAVCCLTLAPVNTFADDEILTSQDGLWSYRILEDGTAEIYGDTPAYYGNEENLVIPDTVDFDAFYMCTSLTNAVLSENLTALPNSVFGGCTSLFFVQGIVYNSLIVLRQQSC